MNQTAPDAMITKRKDNFDNTMTNTSETDGVFTERYDEIDEFMEIADEMNRRTKNPEVDNVPAKMIMSILDAA